MLLLRSSVFVFFMVFGSLIDDRRRDGGLDRARRRTHRARACRSVSRELLQVSVFLAAFSGLYLTVSTVTDETYREQFFAGVIRELERAVGVRAVYLALRDRRPPTGTTTGPRVDGGRSRSGGR